MKTVFKYQLPIVLGTIPITIKMHGYDAYPIHAGEQNGDLFVWAEVDAEEESHGHKFLVLPTGMGVEDVGSLANPVGSVQMKNGLVLHIYYIGCA